VQYSALSPGSFDAENNKKAPTELLAPRISNSLANFLPFLKTPMSHSIRFYFYLSGHTHDLMFIVMEDPQQILPMPLLL